MKVFVFGLSEHMCVQVSQCHIFLGSHVLYDNLQYVLAVCVTSR